MKKLLIVVLCLCLPLFIVPNENRVAVKAGKIVTISGEDIPGGTILIEGNKILRVGKDIEIPAGFVIHDFGDSLVYPGLINAVTTLGISGPYSLKEVNDHSEAGSFNPGLSAAAAFYPWNRMIPIAREFGTLAALSAPQGGYISGKACLVSLSGRTPADMIVEREAALIVTIPQDWQEDGAAKRKFRDYFAGARNFYMRSQAGKPGDPDAGFEAMKSLWSRNLPVIAGAADEKEIRFALDLARDFELNMVLSGLYEGENLVKEIKKAGCPVILGSMDRSNETWEDGYDRVQRLPAALARAGVPFAFSTGGALDSFNLPMHAGRAIAYGLPYKEALKALTLYPARILGLENRGEIAAGKIADLVIASGCILETSTRVLAVFIEGKKITGRSYFQEEYEGWRLKKASREGR